MMQKRSFKCAAKCREQNKPAGCDLSNTCAADGVRVCVVLTWQNPGTLLDCLQTNEQY